MIIRSPRARQNFTIIENALFDSGMSLEAIGLLCYLLSRPDNWRVMPARLADKFGGRDRTYRILKELVDAFYISRKKLMTGEMEYTVFDVPTPDPEKPDLLQNNLILKSPITAKPDPEKPDVLIRTESKQELIGSPRTEKNGLRASDDWPADAWDQFWKIFPNKVGKPVALKAFEKARKRCRVWAEFWAGVLRYVNKTDDRAWLNPATFLNQDRYADQPAENGANNGFGRSRPLQDDSRSAGRAAARLAEAAERGEFAFAPIPSLLPKAGQNDVRLLQEGRGAGSGNLLRSGSGDT